MSNDSDYGSRFAVKVLAAVLRLRGVIGCVVIALVGAYALVGSRPGWLLRLSVLAAGTALLGYSAATASAIHCQGELVHVKPYDLTISPSGKLLAFAVEDTGNAEVWQV